VLAVTLSPFIFGSPAVQSTALQTNPGECRVTTSGKEKPDRVPAQEVWEATFRRISADPSTAVLAGIDGPRALRLATSGASALARANALRQSVPTAPTAGLPRQVSQDRELVIADSILDARDRELRDLSTDEFLQLTDYALETASTLEFVIPVTGRIVADDSGNRYCEAVAKGDEYPHLVTEHEVWRLLFINLTNAADSANERFGGFLDIDFTRMTREMRMPIDDIKLLFRVARDTVNKEKELSATSAGATPAEQVKQLEVSRLKLVMSARHAILRSIGAESWRGFMRYVDQARINTTASFTSPLPQ
ncbi:MAG TPA: hypothetical protein VK575_07525, partial [Gemmatimonadaceae bacterium]|nr:hypothetical protein [Gemmatimonadaceae bacterium]